ncbi:MAG: thiamine pyrophosphate-dependent dehydrogenase E1 component subunit alpha [Beijerinckiaceae bacterium]
MTDTLHHNHAHLLDLYRAMRRIRVFEEIALAAHRAGEFNGYLHASIGQEAVPSGVCANLRRDDRVTSTHRGHGHGLAKGADVDAMMAELYGRATGACGGKGGSMHIADFSVGMLGANGIVAGGLPIAVGAAQGLKLLGSDAVVACFFGDGAANRGPFFEALNWASLYGLRVLFVCEDNNFSAFTYTRETTAGQGILARAASLGVEGVSIDGNDVLAVDAAARALVNAVRRDGAPRILHARTYRWTGHTSTDAAAYRPVGELDRAMARCPLKLLQAHEAARGIGDDIFSDIDRAVELEMRAAQDAARMAPWPEIAKAFTDVQDTGAPV